MEPIIFAHDPNTLYIRVNASDSFDLVPERKRNNIKDLKEICRIKNLDSICLSFDEWCQGFG